MTRRSKLTRVLETLKPPANHVEHARDELTELLDRGRLLYRADREAPKLSGLRARLTKHRRRVEALAREAEQSLYRDYLNHVLAPVGVNYDEYLALLDGVTTFLRDTEARFPTKNIARNAFRTISRQPEILIATAALNLFEHCHAHIREHGDRGRREHFRRFFTELVFAVNESESGDTPLDEIANECIRYWNAIRPLNLRSAKLRTKRTKIEARINDARLNLTEPDPADITRAREIEAELDALAERFARLSPKYQF